MLSGSLLSLAVISSHLRQSEIYLRALNPPTQKYHGKSTALTIQYMPSIKCWDLAAKIKRQMSSPHLEEMSVPDHGPIYIQHIEKGIL